MCSYVYGAFRICWHRVLVDISASQFGRDFDFDTVTTTALRPNYPADNWPVGYWKGSRTGGEHPLATSGQAI